MWNIKSYSIISAARSVGFVAAVLLVVATVLAINVAIYHDKNNEVHRAVMLYDILFMEHPTPEDFEKYLKQHNLTPVTGVDIKNVREFGVPLIEDELLRRTLQSGKIEIFVYKEHYYYAYKMHDMYYYRSDEPMTPFTLYISITAIFLLLLLIVMYRYITMGVKPLKRLHQQIVRFSQGEKDIDTRVDGSDEVAQVANAFHDSVEKVTALEKSRSLFMRNVMHELKTPITKGKLMSVLLEIDERERSDLNELFEQMQTHLNDLAQVESLTAKSLELEPKEYALIDIVEQVYDMLGITEDKCKNYVHHEKVSVDFNLFAYALKNLVDNAIKYAESLPVIVRYKNDCIEVINKGAPLSEDFNAYLKAFARDRNYHSIEGMGLGLYIANEIIEKHGYNLQYEYKDHSHYFKICL